MSDWWDTLPAKPAPEPANDAGHTAAEIDSLTAQAIAAERPAKPAKLTTEQRLVSYLLPQEAPLFTMETSGPRGLVVICRSERHAETVCEAAAVAGIRVEPWTQEALCAVLAGGTAQPVTRLLDAFPGATVRKAAPRIPADEIPFGGPIPDGIPWERIADHDPAFP